MAKGDVYDESKLTSIYDDYTSLKSLITEIENDIKNCILGSTESHTIETKLSIKNTGFYKTTIGTPEGGGKSAFEIGYDTAKSSISTNAKNW